MNIMIDGSKANPANHMRYRGLGMVSANNSSRLLLDYKAEHPDVYEEILKKLFGSEGIGITHLKLEMGSDINSSSGTEPAVKRSPQEPANVTRGMGYQLAADAKRINPELTLDMLPWSEPLWVTNADDVYAARYQWYQETLHAAYQTYGLRFDYVSAVQNERGFDPEWIKYLSSRLKSETDCPYSYADIRIVAGDEVGTWQIADAMLADPELMQAIDVVGSHYTSWATDNAKKLATEYGKELWFSEGSSPMSYPQGVFRYDSTGSGISDVNGLLDIANRLITMYSGGYMTLYQYQPAVAAYYDGVQYCCKQLISACDPWSGFYTLDNGFYMALHFSQFLKKGWTFIDSACFGDGKAGGDGHAVIDAVYSCMTAADPETGDYSMVITNTTDHPISYEVTVCKLQKAGTPVSVWETRGPDGGSYDEHYFRKIGTVVPTKNGNQWTYTVTVKPASLITVSTIQKEEEAYARVQTDERPLLLLPYFDDYEYADQPEDYLSDRGNAPRYTTDAGGAFEIKRQNGIAAVVQIITAETKAKEWGWTPAPITHFGDDRWFHYRVSADVKLAKTDHPEQNYAGIGLRYSLACAGFSGYWIQLFETGSWNLMKNNHPLCSGHRKRSCSEWIHLEIEACENTVRATIDGETAAEYTCSGESLLGAGRAAYFSSYDQNSFTRFSAQPIAGIDPYIRRFDDTDALAQYSGSWAHETMSSFQNYKRTCSTGSPGAKITLSFCGTGLAAAGKTKSAVLSVKIDGTETDSDYLVPETHDREISYVKYHLTQGQHTVELTVKSGDYTLDSFEIFGADSNP